MSHQIAKTEDNFPDFIVIGAMKAGTTSLQHYLDCHPDISMAPKELNFFADNINWHRGGDWYQRHFRHMDKLQGEVSPAYAKVHMDPDIPKRIHDAVPDVKLIYVLREPISRIVSHLSHAIGEDTEGRDPDQILRDSFDHFVDTSRYMFQLERYLEFFDISQILIITSEKLRDRREETLRKIFRFLAVDDSFSSETFDEIRHDSSVKVKRNFVGRAFARSPTLKKLESMAKSTVPRHWYPYFAKFLGTNFSKPTVSQVQKDEIVELLLDDIRKLRELTGYDFEEWGWPR